MKHRHQLLLVSFILEACIFSLVLTSEMLPEKEMRELDIFMQDGEYNQFSRTKRTEDGTSEGQEETEGSAMGDPKMISPEEEEPKGPIISDVSTPVDSTQPVPVTQAAISNNEGNGSTPSPSADLSTPGPTPQSDNTNEDYTGIPTTKLDELEAEENTTESGDVVTSNQTNKDVKDQASTGVPSATMENVTKEPDASDPFTGLPDSETEPGTESSDQSEPKLHSRFGQPSVDVSNTSETGISNIGPEIPEEVNTTPQVTTYSILSIPEGMPVTGQVEITTGKTQHDVEVNNTTKPDIKGAKLDKPVGGGTVVATTVKSVGASESNATSAPKAGESDLPNKSSVSGSGIFFTVVGVALIAALAAVGYYFYKKRQQGYDPVAIEERDKEMTEIKTENGFGKPISAEEIRLDNQLTPAEPKAAPRTFAMPSADDDALENVNVVKEDEEDRDKREQSVEFEEEVNKKNEQ